MPIETIELPAWIPAGIDPDLAQRIARSHGEWMRAHPSSPVDLTIRWATEPKRGECGKPCEQNLISLRWWPCVEKPGHAGSCASIPF